MDEVERRGEEGGSTTKFPSKGRVVNERVGTRLQDDVKSRRVERREAYDKQKKEIRIPLAI